MSQHPFKPNKFMLPKIGTKQKPQFSAFERAQKCLQKHEHCVARITFVINLSRDRKLQFYQLNVNPALAFKFLYNYCQIRNKNKQHCNKHCGYKH